MMCRSEKKNVSDNPKCCVAHLQRMGYGVVHGEQFLINENHLRDGQRARCNVCNRVWEYVIDEAEGSAFVCRSLLRKQL